MKLSEIWIYPIKSLPGLKLDAAQINARGFLYDRHWMLVDEEGKFMSQRRSSRMALIGVAIKNKKLVCSYEGYELLSIPLEPQSRASMAVTVWEDSLDAVLVSEKADKWFSDVLGMPVRLVCMPDSVTRLVDQNYANVTDQTGFSDGFPFLLLSKASVDDLNERINDPQNLMDIRRFRPNLVISGCGPYEEDGWKKIKIGNISFRVVKHCSRCVITTVNPDTAQKAAEPLKTLNHYRKKGNKVFFGQNLIHDGTGELSIGEKIKVIV